jgi:hypothetical protein
MGSLSFADDEMERGKAEGKGRTRGGKRDRAVIGEEGGEGEGGHPSRRGGVTLA